MSRRQSVPDARPDPNLTRGCIALAPYPAGAISTKLIVNGHAGRTGFHGAHVRGAVIHHILNIEGQPAEPCLVHDHAVSCHIGSQSGPEPLLLLWS